MGEPLTACLIVINDNPFAFKDSRALTLEVFELALEGWVRPDGPRKAKGSTRLKSSKKKSK